jgi:30S ribosomal protein S31
MGVKAGLTPLRLLVFAPFPSACRRLQQLEFDMGRGDKRSRKGKIFKGSYGNSRLHHAKKAAAPVKAAKKA